MRKTYKGKFTPKNYTKYNGDPTNIIFRSLWERKAMRYLDENPSVLRWSSEEIAIPYIAPHDGKWHRYYPDFTMEVRDIQGVIRTYMIEVKPEKETKPPIKKKRISKYYLLEQSVFEKNSAKWTAAQEYCKKRGWEFMIITEKHLGIK